MPSRRDLLAGVAGTVSVTAGCLGSDDLLARCSSSVDGSDSQHLRRVAPIRGEEQIALGVLVSEDAVTEDEYHTIRIVDDTGHLVASVALMNNRGMSRLAPDDHPVFASNTGELSAVTLGPPPTYGTYAVSLFGETGGPITTARLRLNCYAGEGELP
jgi:hypothetical protein